MSSIVINGNRPLYGDITVSGMKNAALPILFSTILVSGVCTVRNIPSVLDIEVTLELLASVGAGIRRISRSEVEIDTSRVEPEISPYDLVTKLRGSYYLLGAELGRFGRARVGLPGGCNFGSRPIDQHIKGFTALGAVCDTQNGCVVAYAPNGLHADSIYFDTISVGATANIILASVLTPGTTVIDNAAREPHIVDLANFLNTCGANIVGAGTSNIKIHGVRSLHGCSYTIIPDMIEAGTYMTAVAAAGGRVSLHSVIPKHIETITAKMREMGITVEEFDSGVTVSSNRHFKSTAIKTLPYPGFATDMHPQFAALLSMAEGVGTVTETIWENRFRYVEELKRMGASIIVEGKSATIFGKKTIGGAPVTAVDLRAGAALVVAALAAEGKTEIRSFETIERGYENIVGKLRDIGADISYRVRPEAEREAL